MQHIETVVLGSAAASITFSSIPDTFTDLYLVFSLSTLASTTNALIEINGSTANCSVRSLFGSGSGVTSETTYRLVGGMDAEASNFSTASMYIPNYASTTQAKSWSIDAAEETNATTAYQGIQAGLFNSTTAITSITLKTQGATGDLRIGSSASLYGILAGSDGIVSVS